MVIETDCSETCANVVDLKVQPDGTLVVTGACSEHGIEAAVAAAEYIATIV